MKIHAIQRNIRQSPRKVRLVANQVKNLPLEEAMRQLAVIERRASLVLLKVVKQAIANAMNNHRLSFEDLVLKSIKVTPGSTFKRWNPVSRGRAHEIMKRTSHVTVELATRTQSVQNEEKAKTPQPAKQAIAQTAQKTTQAVAKKVGSKKTRSSNKKKKVVLKQKKQK
jgi:large subunit ribosomal protein L22